MRRIYLSLAVVAAFMAMLSADVISQEANRASIVVTLPLDAKLYFDGTATQMTGTTRTFDTPPLTPGTQYAYDLTAEVLRDGQTVRQTKHVNFQAGQTTRVEFGNLGATTDAPPTDRWPRKVTSDGNTITIYQPQIEKWEGNQLDARAAVSIETKASPQPIYGVMWMTSRTNVDKENRVVTLEAIKVTKVHFPSAPDRDSAYQSVLQKAVPQGVRTTSLDRLEANMAVTRAENKGKHPLKNEPPQVIFSTKPALLVLVDGQPALRQVDGVKLLRIINTRAVILLDQATGTYYLHMLDRWLSAMALDGPWSIANNPPAALQTVLSTLADNPQVDLLDNLAADLKSAFEEGVVPTVYVSTTPAELVETQGDPDMAPIDGTQLLWVKNSTSQILLNTADQNYYVLLSGRWFRSKSLAKGPWDFVAADQLPADFAKVPVTHPRGDVLASVAGTPQSQEAAIANQVPQTATIQRSSAKITPVYDGDPQLQPIQGTDMQYVVNTPTPVIRVGDRFYACENGVWFTAAAPAGPWVAATLVPEVIYTIPPDSPIYYVTNVYVYGYTPEYVYTGYTPGYYGTCLDPLGCVVYGTGWNWAPWIGRYWYGRPWTYGWNARFAWTSAGWGFGFSTGAGRPWWGPVGWNAGWGGRGWRPGWETGWGGRMANTHINHVNFGNFNVYNRWGNNVNVRNTNVYAPHTNIATQHEFNNVMAGHDGNVYRRDGEGWATHNGNAWQHVESNKGFENTQRNLNQDWNARRQGANYHDGYHAAQANPNGRYGYSHGEPGGYGAFHGGSNGFRGGRGGWGGGGHGGGGHGGRR